MHADYRTSQKDIFSVHFIHLQEPVSTATQRSLGDLEKEICNVTEKMLGHSIGTHQPLMEIGLDSLGAVELRTTLQAAFAVDLPATLTFDYPTIAALAKFIASQLSTTSVGTPQPSRVIFTTMKVVNCPYLCCSCRDGLCNSYRVS